MNPNAQILRTGERLWLLMFGHQLAAIACAYGLDTWVDEDYQRCLEILADIGKQN